MTYLDKISHGRRDGNPPAKSRFFHAVTVFQKSDANLTTNAPHRKPASTEGVLIRAHSQAHAWENKSVKSLTTNQFVSRVSLKRVFLSSSFIIFCF